LGFGAVFASAAGALAYGAGTVSCSLLNIRKGPGFDSAVITTVEQNEILVILSAPNGEWYCINFEGTVGYVKSEYITNVLKAENFTATGTVNDDGVRMREKPNAGEKVLTTFSTGNTLQVIGINNGWYKVKNAGVSGYIRSDLMEITGGYTAPERTAAYISGTGGSVVDFAMQFVGSRYVYGGASPGGFDCSGLVYYTFKNFGLTLARTASGQWKNNGTEIEKSQLIPGDLLFFSSNGGRSVTHVGIYIGDNEFVHASTPKKGVLVSRLDSSYYINVWYGAKRVEV
jgi:cell wall-associated NlpC family hydrolase